MIDEAKTYKNEKPPRQSVELNLYCPGAFLGCAMQDRIQDKIFVSFASDDHDVAASICSALERRGFSCWISFRDVAGGENYQEAITRAIRSAKVMVLVFSAHTNRSNEIKKELALASQSETVVIPLRVEDVKPSEALAYELATRQWIDFFKDREKALQKLGDRIAGIAPPVARSSDVGVRTETRPRRTAIPFANGWRSLPLGTRRATAGGIVLVALLGVAVGINALVERRANQQALVEAIERQRQVEEAELKAEAAAEAQRQADDKADAEAKRQADEKAQADREAQVLEAKAKADADAAAEAKRVAEAKAAAEANQAAKAEAALVAKAPANAPVVVPNLIGLALDEAVPRLRETQLRIAPITYLTLGRLPPGRVYNQGIAAGTSVRPGTVMELYVERAKAPGIWMSGQLHLTPNEVFDLDGELGDGRTDNDIHFTISNTQPLLSPTNGALLAGIDGATVDRARCATMRLANSPVRVTVGTNICVQTSRGRLASVHIDRFSEGLTVSFDTW